MPDLQALTTKLAKDKGYTGGSPTDSGLRGFVCPRANAYGGREGIIPPSVAAQKGLVPRGMKQVSVADTSKTANAAREDGKTEAERYLEYYGQGVPETPATPATPAPAPAPVPTPATASTTPRSPKTRIPDIPLPTPTLDTGRDGMFSSANTPSGAEDTLDDFYDSLRGTGFGTGEGTSAERDGRYGRGGRRRTRLEAGLDLAPGPDETVRVETEGGRVNRVARVSAPVVPENDLLLRPPPEDPQVTSLRQTLADLERQNAELVARMTDLVRDRDVLTAQLDDARRAARGPRPSETIRVVLSQDEEKLKVGGKDWECRIMGAIHRSRTGDGFVLSVSDPSYASELLAAIAPGPVAVLSESGRTDCAYRGDCVKIYGEPDTADFIACFRFTVDGG